MISSLFRHVPVTSVLLLAALLVALLAGCTTRTSDLNVTTPFYTDKSLSQEKQLELPPDLSLEISNALKKPNLDELNTIDSLRDKYGALGTASQLKLSVHRSGNDEWVELSAPMKKLWPRLLTFWSGEGIGVVKENMGSGTLVTAWTKNLNRLYPQASTPDDVGIRHWFEGQHQDRYMVTLSPSSKRGVIELRFYHEGKILSDVSGVGLRWLPIPSNEFYRRAMLLRLLHYFSQDNLSPALQSSLRVTGLDGPFQFVQNEYAESYLIIPDTPYRAVVFFKQALAGLGFSGSDELEDNFFALTIQPCIEVSNDSGDKFKACTIKFGYSLSNTIVVVEDKEGEGLEVSASRNFFRVLASAIIERSLPKLAQ